VDDHVGHVFEKYRRAARRLKKVIRRRHRIGQVSADAADALERAEARLLLAAAEVFTRLALHGCDEFLDRVRLEQELRARPHPAAVAASIERATN
jgi:hypothetical protein